MNLFDLAFTSYLYDAFTSFNTSYKDFQNTVDHKLDLSIIEHRKAMITWLNQWDADNFLVHVMEKRQMKYYPGIKKVLLI